MSTAPLCAACPRPSPSGHLCAGCTARLRSTLRRIPGLLADLELTVSKQDGTAVLGARGIGHEMDLPLNLAAAVLYGEAIATIGKWTRHAEQAWRVCRVSRDPVTAPLWLAGGVEWWSHREASGEMLSEFRAMAARIVWAIDRRTELEYFGRCEADVMVVSMTSAGGVITATADASKCPVELYGRSDKATIKCSGCGAVHFVSVRQEWKHDLAAELVLPVALLRAALPPHLARLLNKRTLQVWQHRGQLGKHGHQTYKVREVEQLLVRLAARKAS